MTDMARLLLVTVLLVFCDPCLAFNNTCGIKESEICSSIITNQIDIVKVKEDLRQLLTNFTNQLQKNREEMGHVTEILSRDLEDEAAKVKEYKSCQTRIEGKKKELDHLKKKKEERMQATEAKGKEVDQMKVEVASLKMKKDALKEKIRCMQKQTMERSYHIHHLALEAYLPTDCADLQIKGETEDKVYTIYPKQDEMSVEVRCDFYSEGGGWTIFFHRHPQAFPQDFNLLWADYKQGVGKAAKEYFMGLDALHILSSSHPSSMRIDAKNFTGFEKFAEWNVFQVASEEEKYQLKLEDYNEDSTLGDSLSVNNGCFFTTKDVDNDKSRTMNCALPDSYLGIAEGPWWYNKCGYTRLTAPLKNTGGWDSALWHHWDKHTRKSLMSLRSFSLKLRRRNYKELANALM